MGAPDPLRSRTYTSPDGRFVASLAQPSDAHELAEVFWRAFGTQEPIINRLFPRLETELGRADAAAQFAKAVESPGSYFVKITEVASSRIAASGKWVVLSGPQPRVKLPRERFEDEGAWRRVEAEANVYFERRRRAAEQVAQGSRVFCISQLGVDPDCRGQGAGEAFMRWGLDVADAEGARVVVESSLVAVTYYERHVFTRHDLVDCHSPEAGWPADLSTAGDTPQKYWWMTREPRSSG